MQTIRRDDYVARLSRKLGNGQIKVVTGLRRCGKSYLLFNLFTQHLLERGWAEHQIIQVALDDDTHADLRNPHNLSEYLDARLNEGGQHIVMLDEVQYAITREELKNPDIPVRIYGVLNGLMRRDNVDIYVTGSNSKMLSKDVMTEFRGRGDVVQVHPLSFSEFHSFKGGHKVDDFEEYALWGGMPLAVLKPEEDRQDYLSMLFNEVYFKDIVERYGIRHPALLGRLVDDLCSSVGSLTNANKIANTVRSISKSSVTPETVDAYLGYLTDSFVFRNAKRYDVKGKRYFEYPSKYYCEDIGLRNVRLGLRQQEETHIMENILFNEFVVRGYSIDVGTVEIVEYTGREKHQKTCEIDFVATLGTKKLYVQSALSMADPAKSQQELRPLLAVGDNFTKVVVSKTSAKPWVDERGILHVGIYDFLLDPDVLRF